MRCRLANVVLSWWWSRDARKRRCDGAPWWLMQARTPTTSVVAAFLTMVQRKGGVPTSSMRCEDGEIVEFSGNMMMEEEGGAKKIKWNVILGCCRRRR